MPGLPPRVAKDCIKPYFRNNGLFSRPKDDAKPMNPTQLDKIKKGSGHTLQLEEVIESERVYIKARRAHNEVQREARPGDPSDLWGLCISGGGIRSATLGLGLIQALIREDVFREFDYMSTVSGGGYIGACLTSLMNNDPKVFVNPEKVEIEPGKLTQVSEKKKELFRQTVPGIRPGSSPFNDLLAFEYKSRSWEKRVDLDYRPPEQTRLDTRHQLHHLRLHGAYLTPNRALVSRDIQRLIGTVTSGILHNLTLFLLALFALVGAHYGLFYYLSEGAFFDDIGYPDISGVHSLAGYTYAALKNWLWVGLPKQLAFLGNGFLSNPELALIALVTGMGAGLLRLLRIRIMVDRIRWGQRSEEFRRNTEAGFNYEAHLENRFVQSTLILGIVGGLLLAIVLALVFGIRNEPAGQYAILFSLPFSFSLGLFLLVAAVAPFVMSRPAIWTAAQEKEHDWRERLTRSLIGGLQGAITTSLLVAAFTPMLLITLFSFSITFSLIASLLSIGIAYLTYRQKFDSHNIISRFLHRMQMPVLNLSTLLFVALAFAAVANTLRQQMWWNEPFQGMVVNLPLLIVCTSLLLFLVLGFAVNTNKISLHYFYRDRLSEAYLKTDGRIDRGDRSEQGNPLITLRNDENLRLKDLGWEEDKDYRPDMYPAGEAASDPAGHYRYNEDRSRRWKINARAPYHLIVAALNLQDSDELVRKDLKSAHFIFSRNYVGSASTGYVKTDFYRKGKTKLSRAMAISAAAVSSGMGFTTFFAQSFVTTLFNFRLGYWLENPWYYRDVDERKYVLWPLHLFHRLRIRKAGGWHIDEKRWTLMKESARRFGNYSNYFVRPMRRPLMPPDRSFTFWPYYLLKEMLGWTTARNRMVNVSVGGHTGDNLGLVPLLRRRCKVIVVCDFEEDRRFSFQSFNHAMRIAYIEENITIEINLEELMPRKPNPDQMTKSKSSHTTGIITYIDGSRGTLIYIKSSLSGFLPSRVYNYQQAHGDFPHQSTADQYFDDAQFEAYRALGEHMGDQVVPAIHRAIAGEEPVINKNFKV